MASRKECCTLKLMFARYCFVFVLSLLSFSASAQPQLFSVRNLEGYYLHEKISLKRGLNFFSIGDKKTFVKYFGNIEKEDTPDFAKEQVIVMAMPPSQKESILGFFPNGIKAGLKLEIYCQLDLNKGKIPYTWYPIAVAAIPRYLHVREIHFYDEKNKKLLKKVKLK
jgi:hypothetical protein